MDSQKILSDLCSQFQGYHYTDAEWKSESDKYDWENIWPMVDGSGHLTGDIFESGEEGRNLVSVENLAMVEFDDLPLKLQKELKDEDEPDICL